MKNYPVSSRGFSLVELMFSIATAGVLASMSLGLFFQYQDRSRTVEMDMAYHDIRNSSFLVMQSLSKDVANPVCIWQYDPTSGSQGVACDTSTGQNILEEALPMKDSRIVILSSFNATASTNEWIHTTSIFHCDIASGVNHIDYQNTSDGSFYNIRTHEDPTSFAVHCA